MNTPTRALPGLLFALALLTAATITVALGAGWTADALTEVVAVLEIGR